MQLQRSQIPGISRSIVKALLDAEDIEVDSRREVEKDLESVLNSYVQQLDQVLQRARVLVQERGLPTGEFGRIKRLCADQAGIKIDDDGLDHVLEQLLSMLMNSNHVEEVYAEDNQLRRRMRPFFKTSQSSEERIDREVRAKLKHVQEGSRVWEIEYERMKSQIKNRQGS